MSPSSVLHYSEVPDRESWVIPLWHGHDKDEYDDLLKSIRLRGPDRFDHAIGSFRAATHHADVQGVRFYIGCDLPPGVTMILRPDSRQQAAEILGEIAGFMSIQDPVVPWDRIRDQIRAIREVVRAEPTGPIPSLGLGAIVQIRDGAYVQAKTSWLARHLDHVDQGCG